MAGVSLIGLGPALPSPQRRRLRRLGHVCGRARPQELFHHVAPARAALQGEGHLPGTVEPLQPLAQLGSIGWGDPAGLDLAGGEVHIVVRELGSMNVEAPQDGHGHLRIGCGSTHSTSCAHMPSW